MQRHSSNGNEVCISVSAPGAASLPADHCSHLMLCIRQAFAGHHCKTSHLARRGLNMIMCLFSSCVSVMLRAAARPASVISRIVSFLCSFLSHPKLPVWLCLPALICSSNLIVVISLCNLDACQMTIRRKPPVNHSLRLINHLHEQLAHACVHIIN